MAFIEKALTLETDDCIIFPYGRTGAGYANLRVGSGVSGDRFEYGHVIVCERTRGQRPTPKHVAAHSCGHGHAGCVNKRHLSWKTPAGNAGDREAHGTTAHGKKLTAEAVRSIRALAQAMRHRDLAKMHGVRGDTIGSVVQRRTWAHLPSAPAADDDEAA
ncbi:hypothetical protein X740_07885 [Mesorhizobium sp. LNHC221B00]|nr:hypothetical protein X740_07885 [Mesorhizobium sp. LNHC221B00]